MFFLNYFLMIKLIFTLNLNFPIILNLLILLLISIPIKIKNFHPLKFVTILILLTFIISLKINLIIKSWINFIILLVIIGGLLVIFIYITRLNNNTLSKFNYKHIIKILTKFITLIIILVIFHKFDLYFLDNQELNLNNIYEEKNNIIIIKLFNKNKNSILFIILYLFFSLICIINICYKLKIPLRQINYYE